VSRKFKTALLLLLVALTPLRALATVTVGFCAMYDHGSALPDHDDDGARHGASHDQCESCVEHCASACVVAAVESRVPTPAGSHRIPTPERFAAGYVPDPLDPPPLAL